MEARGERRRKEQEKRKRDMEESRRGGGWGWEILLSKTATESGLQRIVSQ